MRVGIIGLGQMAEIMIGWTEEISGVEITHVCDVAEQRVAQISHRLQAKGYTDYEKMLQEADIDCVYVCVPPSLHLSVVKAAFEQGKHVLCEKPLANSIEEANQLVELAQQYGLVNGIHFTLQYGTAIPKMIALHQQNYLGKIRRIEINLRFPSWPRPTQNVAWVGSRKQGGMALEVCIHLINVIQMLAGEIVDVQSELEYQENPELCEQGIIARMELKDGTPIYINALANIAGNEELISLGFHGTEGSLIMKDWDQLVGGRMGEPIVPIEGDAPTSVMLEMSKAIQRQPARIIDFKNGFQAQIVMEALRGNTTLKRK